MARRYSAASQGSNATLIHLSPLIWVLDFLFLLPAANPTPGVETRKGSHIPFNIPRGSNRLIQIYHSRLRVDGHHHLRETHQAILNKNIYPQGSNSTIW
ncbi:uncharacterized protein G2W53_013821 [Senna tora]|uniref:Uncharacterized protein n=1 Tax=Senna tora TaxID=362788 RepID=A0A834TZE4_9FABA|nr:uncharacterized protein G2W53_013821 [Senna tora]